VACCSELSVVLARTHDYDLRTKPTPQLGDRPHSTRSSSPGWCQHADFSLEKLPISGINTLLFRSSDGVTTDE